MSLRHNNCMIHKKGSITFNLTRANNLIYLLYVILLVLFSYYAFFYLLGEKTLHIWDESRNAASAVEMTENGNVLAPTFDGKIDMWNTKPPLLIAAQALFVKAFGISEHSVRFPSAMAALVSVLFVFSFVSKYTKSSSLGFLSSVILITSPELFVFHGVRSADFEAFLMLFSIAYSLLIFGFIETGKNRMLYAGISCFVLAYFSKSTASLFFIPGIIMYVFVTKKVRVILRNRDFYFAVLGGLTLIFSYYLLREFSSHGYLKCVLQNEFGGRVFSSLENHSEPWYFYISTLWNNGFQAWYSLIFGGLFFLFFEKSDKIKRLFIFCLILAISHLAFISVFETKLIWYVIPEFPFWSILTALSILMMIRFVLKWVKNWYVNYLLPILIALLLVPAPFIRTLKTVKIISLEECDQKNVKLFLRNEYHKYEEFAESDVKFISTGLKQNTLFYLMRLREQGFEIDYSTPDEIKCGDLVLLNEKHKLAYIIESTMNVDTIAFYNENIIAYKIVEL